MAERPSQVLFIIVLPCETDGALTMLPQHVRPDRDVAPATGERPTGPVAGIDFPRGVGELLRAQETGRARTRTATGSRCQQRRSKCLGYSGQVLTKESMGINRFRLEIKWEIMIF